MRIRIISIGSEGDVRPYVALGLGLKEAGHDVRIVTHRGFEPLVRGCGLGFAEVAGDPRLQADNQTLQALHDQGRNLWRWWRTYKEVDAPLLRQRLRDCWSACGDAEAIIVSLLPYVFGYAIAKKLQIPLIRAFYFPLSPTTAYPPDYFPQWLGHCGACSKAAYHLQRQLLWLIARPWVQRAGRDVLDIPRLPLREPFGDLDRAGLPLLYCYSSAVAPPPADWGRWITVTGYWFLDRARDWQAPARLLEFLQRGPAPLYIGGFGSMSQRPPQEYARIVLQALAKTRQRAIVLNGWGGLPAEQLPDYVLPVDWVPFDWLFERVAAVVHHGGAGTTAAGLRAGRPTLIIPFFLDQFFWGRRVHELGVGPPPIRRDRLAADNLASALQTLVTDPRLRERAAAVASMIQSERGVAQAVRTLNEFFAQRETGPLPDGLPLQLGQRS